MITRSLVTLLLSHVFATVAVAQSSSCISVRATDITADSYTGVYTNNCGVCATWEAQQRHESGRMCGLGTYYIGVPPNEQRYHVVNSASSLQRCGAGSNQLIAWNVKPCGQ